MVKGENFARRQAVHSVDDSSTWFGERQNDRRYPHEGAEQIVRARLHNPLFGTHTVARDQLPMTPCPNDFGR